MTSSFCSENLKRIVTAKNITSYEIYLGAGLDHRLDNIYVNRSFVKVKSFYGNPEKDQGATDISLIELEEPFALGSETNLYPCCLLDIYLKSFGSFMFAGYGMTTRTSDASKSFVRKNVFSEEDLSLLMIERLEQIKCDENLICARSTSSAAVCYLDQGGGLLYELFGKLYVTALLVDSNLKNCSSNAVAKYSPVYENLDWIAGYVELDRCFTSNPLAHQTELLLLILISICCFLLALVAYLINLLLVLRSLLAALSTKDAVSAADNHQ